MTLRLSSFGIRGYVGSSLTPKAVMDFASAFAKFVDGGRVLIGRDTRYSSPMIHSAVLSSLLSAGCEVVDFGICPAPILQFSVQPYRARGAIAISGGHHPMGWNAITLIGGDGALLEPVGGENVLDAFHAGDFLRQGFMDMGTARDDAEFIDPYFDALENRLDVAAIRQAAFTVLIDPVGGAGCPFLETFAQRLGFKMVAINAQPSGYLPREPEPRPRSALQMASFIKYVKGDVGFVLNSDMSRVSLVSETGEPASEEYTFPLVADHVLQRTAGPVTTNCCTTRMVDDIARQHHMPLYKCPVGQAFVVSSMADTGSVIGGEGSGSAALPSFSRGFDGFLVMGLVLEAMASRRLKLSEMLRKLPKYHMVKRRLACESRQGYRALEVLKESLPARFGGVVDLTDGLRIDWEDGWVHVRPSRTEQSTRVISEAVHKDLAERRAEDVVRAVDLAL